MVYRVLGPNGNARRAYLRVAQRFGPRAAADAGRARLRHAAHAGGAERARAPLRRRRRPLQVRHAAREDLHERRRREEEVCSALGDREKGLLEEPLRHVLPAGVRDTTPGTRNAARSDHARCAHVRRPVFAEAPRAVVCFLHCHLMVVCLLWRYFIQRYLTSEVEATAVMQTDRACVRVLTCCAGASLPRNFPSEHASCGRDSAVGTVSGSVAEVNIPAPLGSLFGRNGPYFPHS